MFNTVLKTVVTVTLILVMTVPMGKLKYFFLPIAVAKKMHGEKRKALLVHCETTEGLQKDDRRETIWMAQPSQPQRADFEYFFYCCQSTPEITVPPPRA